MVNEMNYEMVYEMVELLILSSHLSLLLIFVFFWSDGRMV